MEINRKCTRVLIILYAMFMASCLAKFAYSLIHTKSAVISDGINEYLVNYEGGFVRRGLAGEMLYWLYNATGWNIAIVIKFISVVAIFLLLIIMYRMMKSAGLSVLIAIMPVSGLSLYFLHFNYAGCRKDPILLLIMTISVYLVREYVKKEDILVLLAINVMLSMGILLHEAFVFMCVPMIACVIARKQSANFLRAILYAGVMLFPTLIVFLLCIVYKGDKTCSEAIWYSWNNYFLHYDTEALLKPVSETISSSVKSLAWTTDFALAHHIDVNFRTTSWGIPSSIYWLFALYFFYYVMMRPNILKETIGGGIICKFNALQLSNILLFNFVFMLPMFTILSCDLSRSFVFLSISSIVLYCVIPHSILKETMINKLSPISSICYNHITKGWREYEYIPIVIFLTFGIPACEFNMYDVLTSSVIGTPIGLLLELIN